MKLQLLIKVYRLAIFSVLSITYIILSLIFHWKIIFFVFVIALGVALYFGKLFCVMLNGVVIRNIIFLTRDGEYQDFIADGYLTPTRPCIMKGRFINNVEINELTLKFCINDQTTRIMIRDLIYENRPLKISYKYFGQSVNYLEVELYYFDFN